MACRVTACSASSRLTFSGGTPRVSAVEINEGPTALHVMPRGPISLARTRVKVSTALLDAAYTVSPANRSGTAIEVTFTMRPWRERRSSRMAAWQKNIVPRTLVPSTWLIDRGGVSGKAFMEAVPALLMSTSSARSSRFNSAKSAATAPSSATSTT